MKKSDFKTFDIVTLCNGTKYFYLNEHLIPTNKIDSILSLEFYNDDLTRTFSIEKSYDIIRVIRWDDSCGVRNLSDFIDEILNGSRYCTKFKNIFERKETLELTIDDIARNIIYLQIRLELRNNGLQGYI